METINLLKFAFESNFCRLLISLQNVWTGIVKDWEAVKDKEAKCQRLELCAYKKVKEFSFKNLVFQEQNRT